MGHQALHFSKAIQRSVGWPFCVERREGRGSDEEAPSISVVSEKVCKRSCCFFTTGACPCGKNFVVFLLLSIYLILRSWK